MESTNQPSHEEIELLAYTLWQKRGSPFGTPEVDWFDAELQLGTPSTPADPVEPVLSTVAKTIGSALGSVAALIQALPEKME